MIEDISYRFSHQDIKDNILMAILCYVGIFVLIPILVAKHSPYVRHNINQGLILCLISVLLNVFSGFLMFVPLGSIFAVIINFVVASICLTAIVHVVLGKAVKFPYIGDYELIK